MMEQRSDGNYYLVLTPEQVAALERMLSMLPPIGDVEELLARMSPEDWAQLDMPFHPPFGGGNETDES